MKKQRKIEKFKEERHELYPKMLAAALGCVLSALLLTGCGEKKSRST
ncbi:hypothetical protein NIA69_06810 [Gemmiger formicilis]|nr:hypothetical protein [Gemmiger formicilis]